MKPLLSHNAYGKSAVRLTKVVRDKGTVHEFFEMDVAIQLEGDFAAAYTDGDNRSVIATDTIKVPRTLCRKIRMTIPISTSAWTSSFLRPW